jgi:phage repressor protein C with HTH and peptisase S24 domain
MKQVSISSVELVPLMMEALKTNQSIHFKVSGTSMMPFFKHQQTVVTLMRKETYKKNDVVLFKYQGMYRLHRIIKIQDKEVIASGDNLLSKERFEASDIIGYVESFELKKKIGSRDKIYKLKVFLWKIVKPVILRLRRGLR